MVLRHGAGGCTSILSESMNDNYTYASNNTGRTGRDGPTPRHGGAAGRRHADHP